MTQQEKFVGFLRELSNGNESLYQKLKESAVEQGIKVGGIDDEQLETVKRDFVEKTVLPRVGNALAKSDERQFKFYSEVAKTANKYTNKNFNRDYSKLTQLYGRNDIAGLAEKDDKWVALQAALQGTSPDIIRKEINDAWMAQRDARGAKSTYDMNKKIADDRKKIWDSEDDTFGKIAKAAGNIVVPELTNWAEESVKKGIKAEGMGKAILKDIAYNVGSIALSGGLGSVAGALTKAAPTAAKVIASSVAGGASAAGAEAAREAASDYEEFDPMKIASTAAAGATVSGIAKKISSGTRNVSGGKELSKDIRGTFYGEGSSAAENLQQTWNQTKKNFKGAKNAMEKQGTKEMIEHHAKELNVKPATVKKYLKEGKTPDLYSGSPSAKTIKKNPNLFPEEIADMKRVKSSGDKAANIIKKFGSISTEKIIGPRNPRVYEEKKTPNSQQSKKYNVDETTIRMWKAGFKPNSGDELKIYEQWAKENKK